MQVKRCGLAIIQTSAHEVLRKCPFSHWPLSESDSTIHYELIPLRLCLVTCHSYSNSLRHASFSHCLNPRQPRAFDPIKLIIKTEPLRSHWKWQAISEESFVHKIKNRLNIEAYKVGGARPGCAIDARQQEGKLSNHVKTSRGIIWKGGD